MKRILVFVLGACWASNTVAFAPMTPISAARLGSNTHNTGSASLRTPHMGIPSAFILPFAKKQQEETTNETRNSTGPTFRERLADIDQVLYEPFKEIVPGYDSKWLKAFAYLYWVLFFPLLVLTYGHYCLSTHKTRQSWVRSAIPWVALFIRSLLRVKLRNRKWDKELDKEHDYTRRCQNSIGLKLPPPSNGTYVTTMEDKSDDEHVIQLTFQDDGSFSGLGEDFTVIDGAWTKSKVRWTEQYIKYSAIIRGERLPDESIKIFYPSDRGTYTVATVA